MDRSSVSLLFARSFWSDFAHQPSGSEVWSIVVAAKAYDLRAQLSFLDLFLSFFLILNFLNKKVE